MISKKRKLNLVTLFDQKGMPLSFDLALKMLVKYLMILQVQSLVQTPAEIGSVLYEESRENADKILR